MPRRRALLVATYRHQDAGLRRLRAPGHDAEALAAALRHPGIAGFDVTILINEPNHVVGRAIGEFYRTSRRDDLTLLYFTGHGLKDDHGRLYLAMTDTARDGLLFTAVSAQQIDDALASSPSRQKILVLDCCYSGAFPAGALAKADSQVHTLDRFQGRGRVVLTASDATQYAFEGNRISGSGTGSVFTRFLVEGLTTGRADLDGDGDIALDELYSYVYERVIDEMPQQRPKKQENVEGRIILARNIQWTLPAPLRQAMRSSAVADRLAALDGLARLYRIGNHHVRTEVLDHIRGLAEDHSAEVRASVATLLRAPSPDEVRPDTSAPASPVGLLVTAPDRADPGRLPVRSAAGVFRRLASAGALLAVGRSRDGGQPSTAAPSWAARGRPGPRHRAMIVASAVLVMILLVGAVVVAARWVALPPAIAVGDGPVGVAITPDGKWLYVANESENTVSVIDTASRQVIDTVGVHNDPSGVAVDRDSELVYVTNRESGDVSVIAPPAPDSAGSGSGHRVINTIRVGDDPRAVALTPDGKRAYVANSTSGDVTVLDTSVPKANDPVRVGGSPVGVALGPLGAPVYVTDDDDGSAVLKVIDTASNAVRTIPTGDGPLYGVAVTRDGSRIFVTHDTKDYVSVIDTANERVSGDPSVGDSPRWLAVAPDGRHVVVSNFLSGDVSVIDGVANTLIDTIPIGRYPWSKPGPTGVAFTPDGRRAYVADYNSDTVSVIDIDG